MIPTGGVSQLSGCCPPYGYHFTVYDAIFRAIINAGGSRSVAANVANAVREVLEWTLF